MVSSRSLKNYSILAFSYVSSVLKNDHLDGAIFFKDSILACSFKIPLDQLQISSN